MIKKQLIFLCLFPVLVLAAPAWRNEVNIPKTVNLKAMPPTHLGYELSWNGRLKAGTVDILLGKKDPRYPKHYVCQAYGGSTGWARALYPFSMNYIGFLHPKSLRPIMFVGNETEHGKLKNYSNNFTTSKVTATKTTTKKGEKPKVEKEIFIHQPALDLFSALLQARSLPLKIGDNIVMPLYPVSTPYLARLSVLGHEDFGGRKAIKIDVKLQKINDKGELVAYDKMKNATLWLSDDDWRVPLELRVEAFIGDVRMTLKKHDPLP